MAVKNQNMLGRKIRSLSLLHHPPIPSILGSLPGRNLPSLSFPLNTQFKFHKTQSRFLPFAQNGKDELSQEPNKQEQLNLYSINGGGGDGGGDYDDNDLRNDLRTPSFNFKWVELLLDPDPDNIPAVGLTGLLAWASVQVLLQLSLHPCYIILAAVKYSSIKALVIFPPGRHFDVDSR